VKTFLLAALVATFIAAPAAAETHKIPGDNPSATVTVPDDGWSVSPIAKGVEISSDDDEVYMAVEGVPLKDLVELVGDTVKYLNREGVQVDKSTEKETSGTINGMDMRDIGWSGRDKDGDVIIHLLIVAVSPTDAVLFTYWASPTGDKEHDAAITKIVRSIRKSGA
jgi:hypothetical protein